MYQRRSGANSDNLQQLASDPMFSVAGTKLRFKQGAKFVAFHGRKHQINRQFRITRCKLSARQEKGGQEKGGGLSARGDASRVTGNLSQFFPHRIDG
jgi:hypothetical protein